MAIRVRVLPGPKGPHRCLVMPGQASCLGGFLSSSQCFFLALYTGLLVMLSLFDLGKHALFFNAFLKPPKSGLKRLIIP